MLYAVDENGTRLEASPNKQALCPGCRAQVISKCGEINVWHWAHRTGGECDTWYEPETQRHIDWKRRFAEQCREVVIAPHRADIRATRIAGPSPCVIELQHSPLEPAEIRERETFYGLMFWIVDASGFKDHLDFKEKRTINGGATVEGTFKWKWPRKSWAFANRTLFFDLGDGLWQVTGLDEKGKGDATSYTYHEFLSKFSESEGKGVSIHWRSVGTGGLVYRFGSGNVQITEKDGSYLVAIYRESTGKMSFGKQRFPTLEQARLLCEGRMHLPMKGG